MPLGTTDLINFFILSFWYLIRISKFDILVTFTNFWQTRKRDKFDTLHKKTSISYTPRSPLQNLLMPFCDITTLIFGLSERDGFILDQCVVAETFFSYFFPSDYRRPRLAFNPCQSYFTASVLNCCTLPCDHFNLPNTLGFWRLFLNFWNSQYQTY